MKTNNNNYTDNDSQTCNPEIEPLTKSRQYLVGGRYSQFGDRRGSFFGSNRPLIDESDLISDEDNDTEGIVENRKTGSTAGSILNLFASTVGAGALSLPYAYSRCGLIVGVILMVGVCKATEFSVDLMIQTRLKSGLVSYEEMAMGLYNEKIANAVAVAILVMTFGASVAFILAVGDILEAGVLDVFGGSLSRQNLMVIFWALFMLPLSILENMNSLRFFSGFGVLNSFYLVFATTLHAIHHFSEKGFPNFSNDSSASLWPSSLNGVIEACPILIFAYICQINIFSLFEELKDGTAEKFATVTRGGIAAISSFYFLLATFTFLEFGDKTQDNILTNYCVAKNPEPLMVVAYVGYALTITMAYPMCTFPCRYTVHVLLHRLFGTRERHYDSIPKMGKSRRVMISTIISCGSVLTALVAPGISSVFGIVGGTAASFICFILPAMFAIKLKLAEKWSPQYIYTWLLFFGGISIGLLSTIITVNAAISRKVKPESPCSS